MIIGYGRTSTLDQQAGLDAQVRDLQAAGAEKLFTEQVSSVAKREVLEQALEWCREGDVLAVTKIDRLARSVADLLTIVARLERKGVGLIILSMGGQTVDSRSATGKLTLTMLSAVAEFERSLMLERQREGVQRAKQEKKYKGRAPTVERQREEILRLHAEKVRPTEIAKRLGIARSSVYRMLE